MVCECHLQSASTFGGAQFYISCGQINVTGGGSGNPGPLVAIPGVYTGREPGIMLSTPSSLLLASIDLPVIMC